MLDITTPNLDTKSVVEVDCPLHDEDPPMRSLRLPTRSLLAFTLAVTCATSGVARADVLYLGQHTGSPISLNFTFNGTRHSGEYGGNFAGSTLNGQSLPFLYCVDLNHRVTVNTTYNPTSVTQNASLFTRTDDRTPTLTYSATTAGRVVSLLQTYAYNSPDEDHQAALQAAIWSELYGSNFTLSGSSRDWTNVNSIYHSILASSAYTTVDPLTNSYWLTPYTAGSGGTYTPHQGEVTLLTPEPASVAMLGIGVCCVGLFSWVSHRQIRRSTL